ncbi:MAG: fasciclin domain-containing protein [Synechococcales bacterium]|nr:fasciclin domain-containing protein [Synechococcales bacterium]
MSRKGLSQQGRALACLGRARIALMVAGLGITAGWGLTAPAIARPELGNESKGQVAARVALPLPVQTKQEAEADVVDVAIAQGSLNTLVNLLSELGMLEDLRGYGRFTVFAPTDAAFAALPENVQALLASDRELLADVLAYHVVADSTPLYADQVDSTLTLRTLERGEIEVRSRRGTLYVNDTPVIEEDIPATNGVIHVIDQVLLPPDLLR